MRLGAPLILLGLFLLAAANASGQAATGQAAGASYYVSDAAAFPVSALPAEPRPGEAGAPEYYLKVESSGGGETRTLFRNGTPIEIRTREPLPGRESLERLYKDGVLREEARFGPGGFLLEESSFELKDGEARLRERRTYRYQGGRLGSVEALDAAAAPIGRLDYVYDAAGRLAELRSSGSFGEGRSSFLLASSLPLASWSSEGGEGLLRIERFDEKGRRVLQELKREGVTQSRESYRYGPGGELLSLLSEDLAADASRESFFGDGGRPRLLVERKGQKETARIEYSYDAEGRLLLESERRGGESSETSYFYDAGGSLLREETRVRGQLSRIMRHESEAEAVEELFQRGSIFVRIRYKDGKKVLEEFLEGGVVVRSKAYR